MKKAVFIFLLSLIYLYPVAAAYGFCFDEAGEMFGIPPELLQAIAKVESNYDPSAIHRNKNGSCDRGLMQINSWWADKLGSDVWTRIDEPCVNVMVGAGILADLIKRHGYIWKSVGYYHSRDVVRQKTYIQKVHRELWGVWRMRE